MGIVQVCAFAFDSSFSIAWAAFFCNPVTAKHPPHFAPKLASNRWKRLGRFLFVRNAIYFRSRGGLVQTAPATKREGGAWQYATPQPRNFVTPRRRRFDVVRPQSAAALPFALPPSQGEDVFLVSVFPPHSNQAKGWRRLSRWTQRFTRPFQPTSFGRRLRNGRIRRGVIPARLMSRGSGPDRSGRLQGNNVRSLGRTRFEPISTRTGASPSFLRRLQRQSVSSLSLRFPFFEAKRPLVGARLTRRHPAGGNITRTKGVCQVNSQDRPIRPPRSRARASPSFLPAFSPLHPVYPGDGTRPSGAPPPLDHPAMPSVAGMRNAVTVHPASMRCAAVASRSGLSRPREKRATLSRVPWSSARAAGIVSPQQPGSPSSGAANDFS